MADEPDITAQRSVREAAAPRRAAHPLGPWLVRTRPAEARPVRLRAAVVLVVCATVLAVAAWLRPDPTGYGSHQQLGQAPCSWITMWGIPCPTCGMSTAFAHTVRGHAIEAVRAQPLGFLLAVATIVALLHSLYELTTGRGWRINWYRVRPWWVITGVLLSLSAAWAYKIMVMS